MIIFLIITSCITVYAGANSVTLETAKTEVEVGGEFTVKVKAVAPDGISGLVTTFGYDKEKLELVSKVKGEKFVDLNEGITTNEIAIFSNFENITEANVYEIVFKVKEGVEANSVVKITLTDTLLGTHSATNSEVELPGDELEIKVVAKAEQPGGDEPGDEPGGDEPTGECKHSGQGSYVDNGDGTHSAVCGECGEKIVTEKHTYENGVCKECKAKEKDDTAAGDDYGYAGLEDYLPVLIVAGVIAIVLYKKTNKYRDI